MHTSTRIGMIALLLTLAVLLPLCTAAGSAFNFVKDPSAPEVTAKPTEAVATLAPAEDGIVRIPAPSEGGVSTVIGGGTSGESTAVATGETPLYGKTNAKGVNVRASASGDSAIVDRIGVTGTVFEIVRETENAKGETWYVISLGGIKEGYLRVDLVESINQDEYESARYSVVPRPRKTARASSSKKATEAPAAATATATQSGVIIVSASPSTSPTASAVVNDTATAWTGSDTYYHSRSQCNTTTLTNMTTVSGAVGLGKTKCPTCW